MKPHAPYKVSLLQAPSMLIFSRPSGGGVQFPISICGLPSTFFGKHLMKKEEINILC
jgi:hypothetical protein